MVGVLKFFCWVRQSFGMANLFFLMIETIKKNTYTKEKYK